MNCFEVKYYLYDYSRGILLDELRTEIHEHLNCCNSCAKAFDEIISLGSKPGLKSRTILSTQKTRVKIHKNVEGNKNSKRIIPKIFPSVSSLDSESDDKTNNFLLQANENDNQKLFVSAGIVSAIALGIILAFLIFDNTPATYWIVEKISGYPTIESKILTSQGILKVGEKLFTDSQSRAQLKIGNIGEIDIEPESMIQIEETPLSEHSLMLNKGKISTRTWVTPKLFSIKTPSAHIIDLGCAYYLSVDENKTTSVIVKSGWVLVEQNNKKSLVPQDASCLAQALVGLGTPHSNDASSLFKESLYNLDFVGNNEKELSVLLSEARTKDLITLFHLLKYLDQESREKIYDKISTLSTIPQRITRENIVSGDRDTLGRLWVALGLGSISTYQNL